MNVRYGYIKSIISPQRDLQIFGVGITGLGKEVDLCLKRSPQMDFCFFKAVHDIEGKDSYFVPNALLDPSEP